MKRAGWMATALLMAVSGSSWADVLRCGSSIVEAGVSTQELVAKCGEPESKSIEGMNWTYILGASTYVVRVSDSGVVAKIREIMQ